MTLRDRFWPLLGNWTGREEQAASPWAPAASARAMMTFKLDVADAVVVQDYRQVRSDGAEFTGHGVFLLVPGTDLVRWWFFDSYGQPPEPAEGGWQGAQLRFEKQTPRGLARHEFFVVGEELRYRIGLRLGDATEWSRFLTGTYRRISGH